MSRRDLARRLAAVFLVLMSTVAGAGVVSAQDGENGVYECSTVDELVWTFSLKFVNSEKCDPQNIYNSAQEAIDRIESAEDAQTANDIYAAAADVRYDVRELVDDQNNYVENTRSTAFCVAQAQYIDSIESGDSKNVTKADVRAAVMDFYSQAQMARAEEVKKHNRHVLSLVNRSNTEPGISGDFVTFYNGGSQSRNLNATVPITLELVNGSSVQTTALSNIYYSGGEPASSYTHFWAGKSRMSAPESSSMDYKDYDGGFEIHVSNTDTEPSFEFWNVSETTQPMDKLVNVSGQVADNADLLVENTYSDVDSGNLSVTQAVDSCALGQEFSTDYNSTGYYMYGAGLLAQNGFDIPDLNETAVMNVAYNGTNYNGLLGSQHAPPGGIWSSEMTYHTADIEGKQLLVTSSQGIIEMDGEFRINSMQDKNGAAVNETTTQQRDFAITNSSEYRALLDTIEKQNAIIEAQAAAGAGGSGGSGSGGTNPILLGALGALALVGVLMATREQ